LNLDKQAIVGWQVFSKKECKQSNPNLKENETGSYFVGT